MPRYMEQDGCKKCGVVVDPSHTATLFVDMVY
eukprot:SAG31_NODE_887_length_11220_cov_9.210233_7_plen_32_part_00